MYRDPLLSRTDEWKSDDQLWADPSLQIVFARVQGTTKGKYAVCVVGEHGEFEILVEAGNRSPSEERVHFYAGFTYDGSMAYGVSPIT